MPIGIGALGLALGAVGQGAQMIGQAAANKKQFKQTKELMNIQKDHNREAAEYNNEMQMKMWQETGPQGQMEQLKAAGLNPGLIYGMGGAGGQTAQAAQQAPVSGGQAQVKNVAEGAGGMGLMMASQLALMQAQKENIEADTANKNAGADNTKADTLNKPKVGANLDANTALTKVNTEIVEGTKWQVMGKIQAEMERVMNEVDLQVRQKHITAATQQTIIDQAKADLAGKYIENELKKMQTGKTEAEIGQIAQSIAQRWKEISQKDTELSIKNFEAIVRANYPGISQVMGARLNEGWRDLLEIFGLEQEKVEKPKK